MAPMPREIVGRHAPGCSPITTCGMLWRTWNQRRPRGIPQPHARRIPLDPLLAQADEQVGELGGGQPRGILHDDDLFLMRSWMLFS